MSRRRTPCRRLLATSPRFRCSTASGEGEEQLFHLLSVDALGATLGQAFLEAGCHQGMADQATDLFLREQDEAMGDTLESETVRVDHALAKLENRTYGYCERCGVPIPAERLEVVPAAEFCVPCAELV